MYDTRLQKAEIIAKNKSIRRINDHFYKVKSQSGNGKYDVISKELAYVCSCPDHKFRGVRCKHIQAVIISFALRKEVESHVISPISFGNCPQCKSKEIVKHGVRHNKSENIQRYSCKQCGNWFTHNLGFERMHATPHIITSAMQLYFSGESFRNIRRFLDLQRFKISHVAVFKWIKKYVTMMGNYLEQITPNVGDAWRTDELYVKIRGNLKYLYAIMDDETRFWIAQQVACPIRP